MICSWKREVHSMTIVKGKKQTFYTILHWKRHTNAPQEKISKKAWWKSSKLAATIGIFHEHRNVICNNFRAVTGLVLSGKASMHDSLPPLATIVTHAESISSDLVRQETYLELQLSLVTNPWYASGVTRYSDNSYNRRCQASTFSILPHHRFYLSALLTNFPAKSYYSSSEPSTLSIDWISYHLST